MLDFFRGSLIGVFSSFLIVLFIYLSQKQKGTYLFRPVYFCSNFYIHLKLQNYIVQLACQSYLLIYEPIISVFQPRFSKSKYNLLILNIDHNYTIEFSIIQNNPFIASLVSSFIHLCPFFQHAFLSIILAFQPLYLQTFIFLPILFPILRYYSYIFARQQIIQTPRKLFISNPNPHPKLNTIYQICLHLLFFSGFHASLQPINY